MKKKIFLLVLLLLTGCKKNNPYKYPEELKFEVKEHACEVYSSPCKLYDFLGDNNVKITTKNMDINTDKVKEEKVTIDFTYNKKEYKYDLTTKVIDTVAPVFIQAASIRTVKVNDDFYPCNEIVFGDNYDKLPTCEIKGEYDLTIPGSYDIKYVIKDSSNNETEKKLKLNVLEEIPKSNPSTPTKKTTLSIDKVIKEKKNENTMIGIDISRWQETIDFNKVKEAGVEFVIMRMGINSDIDKDLSMDSYFENNIKMAKEAGLKVGVYIYTAAIDNERALEHAKWMVEKLNGETLDFPVAYDWENWSKFRKYGISIHDLDEAFNTFAKYLKDNGYDTMLYSSKFYLENIWTNKNNYPVWLAHYTNNTDYKGDYILWQMSNVGRVNGINGDVDIDIFYTK